MRPGASCRRPNCQALSSYGAQAGRCGNHRQVRPGPGIARPVCFARMLAYHVLTSYAIAMIAKGKRPWVSFWYAISMKRLLLGSSVAQRRMAAQRKLNIGRSLKRPCRLRTKTSSLGHVSFARRSSMAARIVSRFCVISERNGQGVERSYCGRQRGGEVGGPGRPLRNSLATSQRRCQALRAWPLACGGNHRSLG